MYSRHDLQLFIARDFLLLPYGVGITGWDYKLELENDMLLYTYCTGSYQMACDLFLIE